MNIRRKFIDFFIFIAILFFTVMNISIVKADESSIISISVKRLDDECVLAFVEPTVMPDELIALPAKPAKNMYMLPFIKLTESDLNDENKIIADISVTKKQTDGSDQQNQNIYICTCMKMPNTPEELQSSVQYLITFKKIEQKKNILSLEKEILLPAGATANFIIDDGNSTIELYQQRENSSQYDSPGPDHLSSRLKFKVSDESLDKYKKVIACHQDQHVIICQQQPIITQPELGDVLIKSEKIGEHACRDTTATAPIAGGVMCIGGAVGFTLGSNPVGIAGVAGGVICCGVGFIAWREIYKHP